MIRGLLFLLLKCPLLNSTKNNWSSSHNPAITRFIFCEIFVYEKLHEKFFGHPFSVNHQGKRPRPFKNKGTKKEKYANKIKLKIPITNQKGSEKNQANNQPDISKIEL